jgi:hypothetical protein
MFVNILVGKKLIFPDLGLQKPQCFLAPFQRGINIKAIEKFKIVPHPSTEYIACTLSETEHSLDGHQEEYCVFWM